MSFASERFKTKPYNHQLECLSKFGHKEAYALFAEMGTGKTFVIIKDAVQLWSEDEVNGLLVFAPNGVHSNWHKIELPKHMPDWVRWESAAWYSSMNKKEKADYEKLIACADSSVLRVFCVNWDALQSEKGVEAVEKFCRSSTKLMIVGDESTMIKNPSAIRTKALMKLKKYSRYRRIMNGTPVSNSPFDLFSQFSFLDETILGTTSYYAFKAEYAEMLPSGHRLIQSIVDKKVSMKPATKQEIAANLLEIKKRLEANGRKELLIAFGRSLTAYANEQYEEIITAHSDLRSMFGEGGGRAKAELLSIIRAVDERVAAHLRAVASAYSPNRLPQIVDRNKDGTPAYKNLDKLEELIAPHSFRVLKKDCLDLPQKVYKTVLYKMTADQRKAYDLMKDELRLMLGDMQIPVQNKLVALGKLAQIASGYYLAPGTDEPQRIKGKNPKLELLKEWAERIVNEHGKKLIIWARYHVEIQDIKESLQDLGISHVLHYGESSKDEREQAKEEFQNGDAMVFVGQQSSGGVGITLTAASWTIYYSNTFSLYHRLQSEDRNHRIGQDEEVNYIDFVAEDSIEQKTLQALQNKKNIADIITGDAKAAEQLL